MPARQRKRKTVKLFHRPGDFHAFTFSCYQRKSLLVDDDWRRLLSVTIQSACESQAMDLVAFVYMPEHVHLLVYPRQLDPDLGLFLALFKQPFSSEIKSILKVTNPALLKELTIRERPNKMTFRYWQEGPGYDRNIRTPRYLESTIDYIHMNPVRRGLCQRAIDWPWSSARYYLLDPPRQQFAGLPYIHGVMPGAFDRGTSL